MPPCTKSATSTGVSVVQATPASVQGSVQRATLVGLLPGSPDIYTRETMYNVQMDTLLMYMPVMVSTATHTHTQHTCTLLKMHEHCWLIILITSANCRQ
jgi:hypothetical protein